MSTTLVSTGLVIIKSLFNVIFCLLVIFVTSDNIVKARSNRRSSVYNNDLSLNKYTEKGEIAQLVYSSLVMEKDCPLVAFTDPTTNIAVIIVVQKQRSPLMLNPFRKLEVLKDEKLLTATCGYIPDCRYVRNHLFQIIQQHRLLYGESPPLENLSSQMATWVTRGLYLDEEDPIARPLATSLLLVSFCLAK